jgi:predicted alpha/beta-fold hydrolase
MQIHATAARREPGGPAPFAPPFWLRNRHVQTILDSLPPRHGWARRRAAGLRGAAHSWLLDCGGGVRLRAWHTPARSPRGRTAVLLHGWEGRADSGYVLALAAALHAQGYGILRLALRDHDGTQDLNEELFHSCRLAEVCGALRAVATRLPGEALFLAGFSLGGNFFLRACAEPGLPPAVAGAVAISPVLEPARTLAALERGWFVYRSYFVRRWSRSLRRKQQFWPQRYDFAELLRRPDLTHMTAELVRECTDFSDMQRYLDGYAITGARLITLSVPARILAADDDPMIPPGDLERLAPTPLLAVQRWPHGGHCGFAPGVLRPSWSNAWVMAQFEAFAAAAARAA